MAKLDSLGLDGYQAQVNKVVVMGAGGSRKLRYFDIFGQQICHFSQKSPYLTKKGKIGQNKTKLSLNVARISQSKLKLMVGRFFCGEEY